MFTDPRSFALKVFSFFLSNLRCGFHMLDMKQLAVCSQSSPVPWRVHSKDRLFAVIPCTECLHVQSKFDITSCSLELRLKAQAPSELLYPYLQDLEENALTKEQEELVGKGYAGPPVSLDQNLLTEAQVLSYLTCCATAH